MCHESSGSALNPTIGIGKGTVSLDDIHDAELIFVVGQNPGTNHPRMLSALKECKDKGGKVVAVNPLPEAGLFNFKDPQTVSGVVGGGTPLADEYLQIKVGGDLALFQALGHLLLEAEEKNPGTVVDHSFIAAQTDGFDAYREARRSLDWDETEKATGLDRAQIEKVASMLVASKASIFCWALGVTQQPHSVDTIKEMVNVLLLQGNFGKPGAGACPVRGHSNVQGDRTMGIWEKPTEWLLQALDAEFGITSPRHHGYDAVESMEAFERDEVDVFVSMGGNFSLAHRSPGSRDATDRADRAHLHQTQPLPHRPRPHFIDPSHTGPDRQGRQTPQRSPVPLRGGLHVRGPLHPGTADPGLRTPAGRAGDRGPDGRGHVRPRPLR
jgi:formate dehydrogenase major subunit